VICHKISKFFEKPVAARRRLNYEVTKSRQLCRLYIRAYILSTSSEPLSSMYLLTMLLESRYTFFAFVPHPSDCSSSRLLDPWSSIHDMKEIRPRIQQIMKNPVKHLRGPRRGEFRTRVRFELLRELRYRICYDDSHEVRSELEEKIKEH